MKQKSSLDIAKFICAILILIIHANPFSNYSKLVTFGFRHVICVIAVPFFFATSGYLLAEKLGSLENGEKKAYMAKYLKRLLVIYLFWSAVYFPFVVIKWLREGFIFGMVLEYIKDFVLEGSFLTIWFLPALLAATALYYWLSRKFSSKRIFLIGCVFYVITLLLSSYYGILERIPGLSFLGVMYYRVFSSVKNGLLFGLVFVALGAMLQENYQITRKKAFFASAASFVLLCGEVVLTEFIGNTRGVDTLASLLPLTAFTLLFVLSFQVKPSSFCMSLRKYSMLIFLCQRIPLTVIELFLDHTVLATNSLVHFATVTAATFLISWMILKLSEKYPRIKMFY